MTREEIAKLLAVCLPFRRLLLETAFFSGLRANELRNLTTDHLDFERRGLNLDAQWTKNRKPGFQPLPKSLVDSLRTFGASGEASRLYAKFYARKGAKLQAPNKPLLYVPSHTSRDLDRELKAAGIPKCTPSGKIDFHACRVAYISLVIESGVTVKEAQELARHSNPELTMNVYGRTQPSHLAQAVERVAEGLIQPERVPDRRRGETNSATHAKTMGCAVKKWWRACSLPVIHAPLGTTCVIR